MSTLLSYCQCVPDDNPPESDINDKNLTTRQADGGVEGLACFPLTGTGVNWYKYSDVVHTFCQRYNPVRPSPSLRPFPILTA